MSFFRILMKHAPDAELGKMSFLELLRKSLRRFNKAELAESFKTLTPSTFAAIQPTIDLVKDLHGRLPLAILTNNPPGIMDEWFETHPYKHFFETIVDSSVVGVRKPDPRIFTIVCERLKLLPSDCLYIEDSVEHADAARSLGFHVEHAFDIAISMALIRHSLFG